MEAPDKSIDLPKSCISPRILNRDSAHFPVSNHSESRISNSNDESGGRQSRPPKLNMTWTSRELADVTNMRRTIASQNRSNQQLRGNNFSIKQSLARMREFEAENENLQGQIRALKLQIRSLGSELALNRTLKPDVDQLQQINRDLGERVVQLQEQAAEAATLDNMTRHCDWLKTRCEALEEEIEELQSEKRELQFDRDVRAQAFDREASGWRKRAAVAENETDSTRRMLTKLESENQRLARELESKTVEIAALQAQVMNSEASKVSLEGKTDSIQRSMVEVVTKSSQLRDTYQELSTENNDLHRSLQIEKLAGVDLRKANSDLTSRLARLTEEHDANVAIFGEMIRSTELPAEEEMAELAHCTFTVREIVRHVADLRNRLCATETRLHREKQNYKRYFEEQGSTLDKNRGEMNRLRGRITELEINELGLAAENRRLKGLLDGLRRQVSLYEEQQGSRIKRPNGEGGFPNKEGEDSTDIPGFKTSTKRLFIEWKTLYAPYHSYKEPNISAELLNQSALPPIAKSLDSHGSYMKTHLKQKELTAKQ